MPIRSARLRDENFRLIWNLMPEVEYANAYTGGKAFRSMIAKAASGDAHAKEFVSRYQYRPEFELFDCVADPLEMNNLAGNPEYSGVMDRLKANWIPGWRSKAIPGSRRNLMPSITCATLKA